MQNKKFQRRKENFICENCGFLMEGDGYQNHCPKCLYSKHVDVNPGDRAAECGGLMEVVDVSQKKGEFILLHQCVTCGHQRKNKTQEGDDVDVVIEIVQCINKENIRGARAE